MILDVTVQDAAQMPSKTWLLDASGHIRQSIDGLDAVAQAARLAIQTQRYEHIIFSWQYGSELHTLLGKPVDYAVTEAKRMISDALSTDSRIKEIRDFSFSGGVLSFTMSTIFGSQRLSVEVSAG